LMHSSRRHLFTSATSPASVTWRQLHRMMLCTWKKATPTTLSACRSTASSKHLQDSISSDLNLLMISTLQFRCADQAYIIFMAAMQFYFDKNLFYVVQNSKTDARSSFFLKKTDDMGTLELLWVPYFAAELKLHRSSVITRGWNVLKLSSPCLPN